MTHPSNFSHVLSLVGTAQPAAGFAFERAVHKLLKALTNDPGCVRLEANSLNDNGWDFIVSQQLGELPPPVYITAKFIPVFSARNVRELLNYPIPGGDGSRLLIVSGRPTKGAEELMAELRGSNVHVWDYEHLSNMLKINESLAQAMIEKIDLTPAEAVKDLTQGQDTNWRDARSAHLHRLNDAWLNDHLTIFLGAGISAGAGLKNWAALLNAISGEAIAKSTRLTGESLDGVVSRFVSSFQGSPLILARYLRKTLSEGTMTDEIRRALYSNVGKDGVGTSEAYKRLAEICAPRRSGFGVRAIVNYNYDDLMIEHLNERKISCRLLTDETQTPTLDELPIYHVHGFLPRDPKQESDSRVPASLVLSEEKYHSLYQDPYNWSNWVQLSFLSSSTCLILGHSLTDPNLRRLLEIAHARLIPGGKAARDSHAPNYAILSRMHVDHFLQPKCPEPDCPSRQQPTQDVTKEEAERFLAKHHETEELLYRELGINVIWIETFEEIPQIIEEIGKTRHEGG